MSLQAGKEESVKFRLTPRDFSIFDETVDDWTHVHGVFTLYVGTSSDNLPLSIKVERSSFDVNIEVL